MELPQTMQLITIILCVIMSAYFSATETAFSTFNRIRVKNLAEKGNKRAERVIKLSDDYNTLISTILIGNNIVNILATTMATMFFIAMIQSDDLASWISTIVMTVTVLILGEITPKTLAKCRPEGFVMFSAPIISFIKIILFPLTFLFKGLQYATSKIFKPKEDDGMTEEELISIIEEAEEDGGLDEDESSLIKSAIEFNDLEVSDIFTPRIDITAVSNDATSDELSAIFSESGYSRLPVYEEDIDNIIGIVYYKDFFSATLAGEVVIKDIVKPVIYVAKTQKINDLLKELQNKQLHFAVVLDEYGSTAGIVTLEDIIEEIVGEIWDEHDEKIEEVTQISEKEYIVDGMTPIGKVFDIFDIDEDIESANVNGWAMEVLGKIPEASDTFTEYGLQVEILETTGKRVEKLRITDVREDDEEKEKKKKSSDEDTQKEAEEVAEDTQ